MFISVSPCLLSDCEVEDVGCLSEDGVEGMEEAEWTAGAEGTVEASAEEETTPAVAAVDSGPF